MITCSIEFTKITFPCGEPHIRVDLVPYATLPATITWEWEGTAELMDLLLLVDALKRKRHTVSLCLPYVPFSRQDRVTQRGETFSLAVFADVINSMGFDSVYITDPHSDVTPALIKNCIITPQAHVFHSYFKGKSNYVLVSPDAGALKKVHSLAALTLYDGDIVVCTKHRDPKTGMLSATKVHADTDLGGKTCVIVDDICDGGGTFVAIAKALKAKGASRIVLLVTHGFFTKGISVFDGLIDEVWTKDGQAK